MMQKSSVRLGEKKKGKTLRRGALPCVSLVVYDILDKGEAKVGFMLMER